MARHWTTAQRQAQRERIKHVKPWEKSTGPRTEVGKAVVSRNAYKGGLRPMQREAMRLIREQEKALQEVVGRFGGEVEI